MKKYTINYCDGYFFTITATKDKQHNIKYTFDGHSDRVPTSVNSIADLFPLIEEWRKAVDQNREDWKNTASQVKSIVADGLLGYTRFTMEINES